MSTGFDVFFGAFAHGMRQSSDAFGAFVAGFAGVGRWIVAQLADKQAEFQIAEAAGKFASAIWPPNPAAYASGLKHLAAAALFKALAAGASGAFSGGGNLAGSAAGSVGPSGASFQGGGDFQRPEMHIYINGEYLDPRNPRLLELVYMGQQFSSEVFAAGQVVPRTAHPRTPRTASPR
jgi:hypothetical protein